MNIWLLIAALLSLLTLGVHLVVGSRLVVAPLLAVAALTPASRWMMFFTWHMASVLLAAMAGGFAWAALHPEARDVASLLLALAAANALLCLAVALRARIRPWRIPAFVLFCVISAAALGGLVA